MNKYFELIIISKPCPFILQDGSRFDLQTGFPKNSYDVFKTGFEFLGLLPGAEKLFKKEDDATLLHLIKTAKRIEDLEVLALVKPTNTDLNVAIEEKRKQFVTN